MSKAIQNLISTLSEKFPKAFPVDHQAIRPLKIGIDQDIRKACPDLDEKVLRRSLASYCSRYAYLKALSRGGQRIGLNGRPVEAVSPEAREKAQERLRKRLEAQGKPGQPETQETPVLRRTVAQARPNSPICKATITTRTGRPILSLNGKR